MGDKTDALKQWIKTTGDKNIALIPNAMDIYPDGERKDESIQGSMDELSELGFDVAILDLRDYFGKEPELAVELEKYHTVFARGGNAFALRLAMKLSGFDNFLKSKKGDDDFLYGGYSAGICVQGPTMHGLELVDDATAKPYGDYGIEWNGLGLLDFVPVPHFDSDHPESELINEVVNYLEKHDIPYKTLRDGDVIVKII